MANSNNTKPRMIEINLLPDIKKEALVAKKIRNQVSAISIIASMVGVGAVIIMIVSVFIVQGLIIKDQKTKIDVKFDSFAKYNGVNELLTIQNQLRNLKSMHEKKPATSRVFAIMTQLIKRNNLDIKMTKVATDPHKNQIVMEAYSERGYSELERLKKTIEEARVSYINFNKLMEIGNSGNGKDVDEELKREMENSGIVNLSDQLSLLSDPAFGHNSEGRRVLTFRVGFEVEKNFFKDAYKEVVIEGIKYKDVTDSNLSVPEGLFGASLETEKDNQNNQAQSTNESQSDDETSAASQPNNQNNSEEKR